MPGLEQWMAAGAFAAGATWAASTLLPYPGLHERLVPGALFRQPGDSVALTFDDGPHPERTPRLLDVLARQGARATFFVVGRQVLRHPALARRMAREGHLLANHTLSHAWLPGRTRRGIEDELDGCQAAIADTVGTAPTLVRPPYGHRDARFLAAARRRGLTPVLWTVDSFDYLGLPEGLVRRLALRAGAGAIVLMHDGNAQARGTVPALAGICATLRARGLALAPVTIPAASAEPALGLAA
jgi:peptidoglycan/xylan/chitin deacetylase (PgdA/CDA1 family)